METTSLEEPVKESFKLEPYFSGRQRVSQNNQGQYIIEKTPWSFIVINTIRDHLLKQFPPDKDQLFSSQNYYSLYYRY